MSVVVFAPPQTLVAPLTILHGFVWPLVEPVNAKVPTGELVLMEVRSHVPAAWLLKLRIDALAEAGGP